MIEIKNLTKIYHTNDEGAIGLKNVSIKFPEIGFVALTGQSGSGKTTLLNVLSGFQSFEEGEMFIDGVDVLTFQKEDWQKYQMNDIGFIFQDYGLIESYKVIDNIIIVLEIIGVNKEDAIKRANKYLELVNLTDVKDQKVSTLSSGQKQRLSIARAIAKEPKIIYCDEPTANLDPENSKEIMRILGDISKKCLVVTSTHNYEDAKGYANYFIRLYKGSLISYEVVNEINDLPAEVKENGKPNPFNIFFTYLKNRILRYSFSCLFLIVIYVMLLVIISVFLFNLDDVSTRVINKDVFNNINDNELIVMKNDGTNITDSELLSLKNIKHVVDVEKYGLSSDMNYYYREGIDYRYDVKIEYVDSIAGLYEVITEVLNKFNKSLYVKTCLGTITEDDLAEGCLPVEMFDVVASSEYHIGDTIIVYFDNPTTLNNSDFSLEFKVCGVLKEHNDDLFFSEAFSLQLDFIQRTSYESNFVLYVYYKNSRGQDSTLNFSFIPIYSGCNEEKFISFSKKYVELYKGFPDNYSNCMIIDTANTGAVSSSITDIDFEPTFRGSETISSSFLDVSYDIYQTILGDYKHSYSRIYIDEYPYTDDVSNELIKRGYIVMSPYRASSATFDLDRVQQRANALMISIASIGLLSIIYVVLLIIITQMKKKEELTMISQGASIKLLNKFNLIDLISSMIISLVIALIVYLFGKNIVDYSKEAFKYMRFYHFMIVIGLVIILTFASSFFHGASLRKKGGNK